MGYLLQVVCSCTSLTDDKQIKDVPEINSPSGKNIKRTFYHGIGMMDYDDQRSREIYPCYNCGNLTVTRSKNPRCSNPKCRRKVCDFLKQDKFLKCPYCKKYNMEFENIGLWD